MMNVDYTAIIADLVTVVQDLIRRVDALQKVEEHKKIPPEALAGATETTLIAVYITEQFAVNDK
ncbi:hypothetical protein LN650_19715 [Klebsiella pneumoniae subsp. pneumoniae]|nr:hypothetical protein [Klebsiella pneumoniae subsp. pneumoniae]